MARGTVRIHLVERAWVLGLQPRRAAASAPHPMARTILERAVPSPSSPAAGRILTCTVDEARALLDHFGGLTETLTGLGDPDAAVCAAARDSIRRALLAVGA